jgi:PTH2 family peptidyl-tRNA hydrolase
MSEKVAKQVIVMRKDLNMRKGKMIAQGSHASLGAVLLIQSRDSFMSADDLKAYHSWIHGTFTKICVGVNSGDELLRIYHEAKEADLPVKLITDAGHTEFHGVPTLTCLAIGPAWSDDIDKITGGLTLL